MTDNPSIIQSDNIDYLMNAEDSFVDLIYIDPPFNCGKTIKRGDMSYDDNSSREDYEDNLTACLMQAKRILKSTGSIFVHLDWRVSHKVRILLDTIFGEEQFMNEIIWAYDYGGRSKKRWPSKHDTIYWYRKGGAYTFNYDEIDRIPYMAPGLVGPEKAAKGKTPTDVWWHTIVPTQGTEKTGYPTQKPLGILNRIVKVHSNPGDLLMDFFAGSGSFGEAALANGRNVILVDKNPQAIKIMEERLAHYG